MAEWARLAGQAIGSVALLAIPVGLGGRMLVFGCRLVSLARRLARFDSLARGLARFDRTTRTVCLMLALILAGCGEKKARDLTFRVGFACSLDRQTADALQLRVVSGGCEGSDTVYEAELSKGEDAPLGNGIVAGTYGFAATALSEGRVLASSCVEATLPTSELLEIQLQSAECDPPPSGDAGQGGAPGGAGDCPTNCDDLFPCTEDRCVKGACIHDPITGTRDCDGIACTVGDKCQSGSCVPGAAKNAACSDDGNPCTSESCEPGSGCTRDSTVGGSCDDQITCTTGDTCANGVCRGADMCTNGAVCSAASGMCTACGNGEDCDDLDPCTADTCSAGACQHVRNVGASCDDGKSCTSNDLCTATSCEGASTCASDATCAGSLCRCSDSAKTLCSNACVSIASSAQHCGQCGRACGGAATCQNGACKPSAASTCAAYRDSGHDYLICPDALAWQQARDRCRSWGLGLVIIDNQAENEFLRTNGGTVAHWIGASDRGDNGVQDNFGDTKPACTLNAEEGTWYWTSPSGSGDAGDNFRPLCAFASDTATSCTATNGSYQNWRAGGVPDNGGCNCQSFRRQCSEGEDCALLNADGTWSDSACNSGFAFICESS